MLSSRVSDDGFWPTIHGKRQCKRDVAAAKQHKMSSDDRGGRKRAVQHTVRMPAGLTPIQAEARKFIDGAIDHFLGVMPQENICRARVAFSVHDGGIQLVTACSGTDEGSRMLFQIREKTRRPRESALVLRAR